MNPWYGYAFFIVGNIAGMVIRAPHGDRNKKIRIVDDRKGALEVILLVAVGIGLMLLPLLAIATPLLAFADYPFSPVALAAGILSMALYLWLFHRSHADLGTNWSVTLQVRDSHRLVSTGVYKKIRHPMYTSIYSLALAQALLVPNWIAGLSGLTAFTLMFALRLKPEEKMMIDRFKDEYRTYAAGTKRLIPGVW